MFHGRLNYTSLKGATEFFTVSNGIAINMMHEDVVMADGPMAGKHVVRRSTNILERSGDDWVLIARQATYVGFDGAILRAPVTTTYSAPPATFEMTAIRAQIEANNRAVGHAIGTMDFSALSKLWSPGMMVNSPGNTAFDAGAGFRRHARGQAQIHECQSRPRSVRRFEGPRYRNGARRHRHGQWTDGRQTSHSSIH